MQRYNNSPEIVQELYEANISPHLVGWVGLNGDLVTQVSLRFQWDLRDSVLLP